MSASLQSPSIQALADTLWAERQVVEFLLFKLTSAKLLLAADERRFVALALDEVERVVEALRDAEVRRSMAVEVVAREWRVPPDELTLLRLSKEAPEPWREVFADHHRAFGALAVEIEEATAANRSLATAGLSRIHHTMDLLTGQTEQGTYDASGRHRPAQSGPARLNAAL